MSIYGSFFVLDADDHEDGCAVYVEIEPGWLEFSGKPCDCGTPNAPLVYEGSHVLPSDDDRRGGSVDLATIHGEIVRPGTAEKPRPYDEQRPWLRLSLTNDASTYESEGKPYVSAGESVVVLKRSQVVRMRDALSEWLETTPEQES